MTDTAPSFCIEMNKLNKKLWGAKPLLAVIPTTSYSSSKIGINAIKIFTKDFTGY